MSWKNKKDGKLKHKTRYRAKAEAVARLQEQQGGREQVESMAAALKAENMALRTEAQQLALGVQNLQIGHEESQGKMRGICGIVV